MALFVRTGFILGCILSFLCGPTTIAFAGPPEASDVINDVLSHPSLTGLSGKASTTKFDDQAVVDAAAKKLAAQQSRTAASVDCHCMSTGVSAESAPLSRDQNDETAEISQNVKSQLNAVPVGNLNDSVAKNIDQKLIKGKTVTVKNDDSAAAGGIKIKGAHSFRIEGTYNFK